ncbi:MAG: nucleotidyltransferase domain-containing protein [Aquificaceae bacterium]
MRLLQEGIHRVLTRFKRELQEKTGKSLELYLFGSYARGDFTGASDIDLLLLVPEDWDSKDQKVAWELITEYALEYNSLFSLLIVKPHQLQKADIGYIFQKAIKEGKKID